MASAPSPSDSISANGPLCVASRTLPLEPTQIAPECSTTGNSAAARPPVMGSLAFARATRFETTTRFTGPFPDHIPIYKQTFINMVPGFPAGFRRPNRKELSGTGAVNVVMYARTPPCFQRADGSHDRPRDCAVKAKCRARRSNLRLQFEHSDFL